MTTTRNYPRPENPVVDGEKKCRRCDQVLPLTAFRSRKRKSGNVYPSSYCSECHRKISAAWDAAHPREVKDRSESWHRSNRTYHLFLNWRYHLMAKYKLTPEKYLELAGDPPRCGICGLERSQKNRLHVDHCHITKEIRGILCASCNHALERMTTIPNWAAKAKLYLKRAAKAAPA